MVTNYNLQIFHLGSNGWQAGGILGAKAGLDVVTVRSKRSSLVTRGSNIRSGCLSSAGPKVRYYLGRINVVQL